MSAATLLLAAALGGCVGWCVRVARERRRARARRAALADLRAAAVQVREAIAAAPEVPREAMPAVARMEFAAHELELRLGPSTVAEQAVAAPTGTAPGWGSPEIQLGPSAWYGQPLPSLLMGPGGGPWPPPPEPQLLQLLCGVCREPLSLAATLEQIEGGFVRSARCKAHPARAGERDAEVLWQSARCQRCGRTAAEHDHGHAFEASAPGCARGQSGLTLAPRGPGPTRPLGSDKEDSVKQQSPPGEDPAGPQTPAETP